MHSESILVIVLSDTLGKRKLSLSGNLSLAGERGQMRRKRRIRWRNRGGAGRYGT